MSKFPYLPLCVDAYRNDTPHLTLEQHGAYLTLIMLAWRTPGCRLPDDDVKLARMLGVTAKKWAALKPVVMEFWTLTDGFWSQKRLEKERDFVSRRAKTSADNGANGGRPKRLKDNETPNPAGFAQDTQNEPGAKAPNTLHLTQDTKDKAPVEPTENNPEKTEDDIGVPAAPAPRKSKSYAFESGVIRLTEADYEKWEKAFCHISLAGTLIGLTGYAQEQYEKTGNWFWPVQRACSKRNDEARLAVEGIKANAIAKAQAEAAGAKRKGYLMC